MIEFVKDISGLPGVIKENTVNRDVSFIFGEVVSPGHQISLASPKL